MYETHGGVSDSPLTEPLQDLRSALGGLRWGLCRGLDPEAGQSALKALAQAQSEISLFMAEILQACGQGAALGESESLFDWVRHNCRLRFRDAADQTTLAEQLTRLPRSRQALLEGEIGFGHLALTASTANKIEGQGFDERPFLEAARGESVDRFKHTCEKLRIQQDAEGSLEEIRDLHRRRSLRFSNQEDGGVVMSALMDRSAAAVVRSALEPLAGRQGPEDDRRQEARLLDALVELARTRLDSGQLPRQGGVRPHLMVTTSLEALLGAAGAPAAELQYSLPIHPKTLERFACDSGLTRILLDSKSVVIDAGRERRTASGSQSRALHARDQGCRVPGCHRPASACAAHHLDFWKRDGGRSDLHRMVLLCHHHHFLVHEGGWQILMAEERLLMIPPQRSYQLRQDDSDPPPF